MSYRNMVFSHATTHQRFTRAYSNSILEHPESEPMLLYEVSTFKVFLVLKLKKFVTLRYNYIHIKETISDRQTETGKEVFFFKYLQTLRRSHMN